MLVYAALSGLSTHAELSAHSPEGATYAKEGHRPSDKKKDWITSPEGVTYTKEGHRPSDKRRTRSPALKGRPTPTKGFAHRIREGLDHQP